MSKFSHFAYFKQSFNNIIRNRGPLFSRINFDQTYFGGFVWGVLALGGFCQEVCVWEGLCPRTVVLSFPDVSQGSSIGNYTCVGISKRSGFYVVSAMIPCSSYF